MTSSFEKYQHRIEFVFEMQSDYDDESENLEAEQTILYTGDTVMNCLQQAAEGWDFDDEDVINFDAESDLSCTNRDLLSIWEIDEEGNRYDVTDALSETYQELHDVQFEKEMGPFDN